MPKRRGVTYTDIAHKGGDSVLWIWRDGQLLVESGGQGGEFNHAEVFGSCEGEWFGRFEPRTGRVSAAAPEDWKHGIPHDLRDALKIEFGEGSEIIEFNPPAHQKIRLDSHGIGEDAAGQTVMYLDWFEIPKKMRGKGLGKKLYLEWEKKIPKEYTLISLNTARMKGNDDPRGFWEKLGFKMRYDGPPEVMEELEWDQRTEMLKGIHGEPTPETEYLYSAGDAEPGDGNNPPTPRVYRDVIKPVDGDSGSVVYHYEEDMFTDYIPAKVWLKMRVFDEIGENLWHALMRMTFNHKIPKGSVFAEVDISQWAKPFNKRAFLPLFNAAIDEAHQKGAYAIYMEVWTGEASREFFKAVVDLLDSLGFQRLGTNRRGSNVYAIKFGNNPPGKLNTRTWRLVVRRATPRLREDPRRADPAACERAVNAALEETGIDVGGLSTGQIEGLWADVLCAAATLDELQK